MLLFLDTSEFEHNRLALVSTKIVEHKFVTSDLSKNLLPEIKKFLAKQKVFLKNIKTIAVVVGPGGFSKIRTAVATANALAFGLNIEVLGLPKAKVPADLKDLLKFKSKKKMTAPIYDREPNITKPSK